MPRRKTTWKITRKRKPRRNRRRRGRRHGPLVMRTKPGEGFIAPRLVTMLKYHQEFNTSGAVGPFTDDLVFNMNSVFDPQKSGIVGSGSHQPYGFDQLSPLYNRYRVFAINWRVKINGTSDTFQWLVVPNNGALTPITSQSLFITATERPRAVYKSCNKFDMQFVGKMFLPRLNGCKVSDYHGDDRFQAAIGANPTEVMELHIAHCYTGTATVTFYYAITLEYHVEFFDPTSQGGS